MTLDEIKCLVVDNMLAKNGRVKVKQTNECLSYIPDIIRITNFLGDNITLSQRFWHIVKGELKLTRCKGGNLTKFNNFVTGYQKHCASKKCVCNLDTINKIKVTNLAKYGVENPFQSEEIKNKIKVTNLEKYGVENIMHSNIGKSKVKNAILEKYGVENIMYLVEIKTKIKATNLEKYGVEYGLQAIIVKDKTKATNMVRYGVENVFQSENFKDKTKITNLERYCVENVFQSEIIKDKIKATNLEKYNVENVQHQHIKDLVPLINSPEFWFKFINQGDILNYFNGLVSNTTIYNWINKYRPDLELKSAISYPHMIINNFLTELNIDFEINTRQIIKPKELDIFIPSHNLAIEVNGIYWHSESKIKDTNYHLNKVNNCEAKGINLFQFTDQEILNKTDILFSMIKNELCLNENIMAKDCSVVDINNKIAESFYNANNLQGYKEAEIHKGLIYNNELVTLLSISKSNEVTNYANLIDINVIGGFSKLIKSLNYNGRLVSYVNRNYGNDKIYEDSDWNLEEILSPTYQYIKNNKLHQRSIFEKDNLGELLEAYDENLTTLENMIINGYARFWDCGSKVYIYNQ